MANLNLDNNMHSNVPIKYCLRTRCHLQQRLQRLSHPPWSRMSSFKFRFLICVFNVPRVFRSRVSFGNLAHSTGPMYLKECFPYWTVLNRWTWKSLFLKLYLDIFCWNRSLIFFGCKPYFVLNINIAIFLSLIS